MKYNYDGYYFFRIRFFRNKFKRITHNKNVLERKFYMKFTKFKNVKMR